MSILLQSLPLLLLLEPAQPLLHELQVRHLVLEGGRVWRMVTEVSPVLRLLARHTGARGGPAAAVHQVLHQEPCIMVTCVLVTKYDTVLVAQYPW